MTHRRPARVGSSFLVGEIVDEFPRSVEQKTPSWKWALIHMVAIEPPLAVAISLSPSCYNGTSVLYERFGQEQLTS